MTITAPLITIAEPSDQNRVATTMISAFRTDPAVRWLYPEDWQYQLFFPQFVRAFAGRAFEHATAHVVEDARGAALWLPPGVGPDEEALGPLLQHSVALDELPSVFGVLEAMGSYHPAEPHWYLPLLGVEPRWQGQGLGSALLEHALAHCDAAGEIAYLESTNVQNLPLYRRHGFNVLGEIQIGNSPIIFPMARDPQ